MIIGSLINIVCTIILINIVCDITIIHLVMVEICVYTCYIFYMKTINQYHNTILYQEVEIDRN